MFRTETEILENVMDDHNLKISNPENQRYKLRRNAKKNYDEEKFADSDEDEGLLIIRIVIYQFINISL